MKKFIQYYFKKCFLLSRVFQAIFEFIFLFLIFFNKKIKERERLYKQKTKIKRFYLLFHFLYTVKVSYFLICWLKQNPQERLFIFLLKKKLEKRFLLVKCKTEKDFITFISYLQSRVLFFFWFFFKYQKIFLYFIF